MVNVKCTRNKYGAVGVPPCFFFRESLETAKKIIKSRKLNGDF